MGRLILGITNFVDVGLVSLMMPEHFPGDASTVSGCWLVILRMLPGQFSGVRSCLTRLQVSFS